MMQLESTSSDPNHCEYEPPLHLDPVTKSDGEIAVQKYEDDENGTPYGKSSDLWSLGVLLYVILSGCSPFSADEEEAILQLVAEAKFEFHDAEWKEISPEAKDLISQLLAQSHATRLGSGRGGHREASYRGRASCGRGEAFQHVHVPGL